MANPERQVIDTANHKLVDWGSLDSLQSQLPILENFQKPLPETQVSRRDFLKKAFIGLAAATTGEKTIEYSVKLLEHVERARWNECAVSNKEFYNKHRVEFANMELSTTFIPGGTLQEMKTREGQSTIKEDKLLLKTIVQNFGIRNIRVGARLENVIDINGNFTFEFYRWLFDYLADQSVQITANVGIKCNGYPEVFVPDIFFKKPQERPPQNTIVNINDDLAKRSIDTIDKVGTELEEYSDFIAVTQPSNEPFDQFGEGYTMGDDYLIAESKRLNEHLPNAATLINGNIWNFLARGKAPKVLSQLKSAGIKRGILGSDFYPFVPQLYNLPLPMAFRRLDPALLARYVPGFSIMNDINAVNEIGFEHQLTEIQAEEYGNATGWDNKKPGDSAIALRHAFLGAMSLVPDMDKVSLPNKVLFSTWKARPLASAVIYPHEMTADKKEMIEFTKMFTHRNE